MAVQGLKHLLRRNVIWDDELSSAINKVASYEQKSDLHLGTSKINRSMYFSSKASSSSSNMTSGIGNSSLDAIVKLRSIVEPLKYCNCHLSRTTQST